LVSSKISSKKYTIHNKAFTLQTEANTSYNTEVGHIVQRKLQQFFHMTRA